MKWTNFFSYFSFLHLNLWLNDGFIFVLWFWIRKQIKTTSPEKFRVRPSTGILTPGSSTTINVVLQSGPNVTLLLNKVYFIFIYQCHDTQINLTDANFVKQDKFLVMCMEINDLNASQQDIADIWKVWFKNKMLSQSKMKWFWQLKCNFVEFLFFFLIDRTRRTIVFRLNNIDWNAVLLRMLI